MVKQEVGEMQCDGDVEPDEERAEEKKGDLCTMGRKMRGVLEVRGERVG